MYLRDITGLLLLRTAVPTMQPSGYLFMMPAKKGWKKCNTSVNIMMMQVLRRTKSDRRKVRFTGPIQTINHTTYSKTRSIPT